MSTSQKFEAEQEWASALREIGTNELREATLALGLKLGGGGNGRFNVPDILCSAQYCFGKVSSRQYGHYGICVAQGYAGPDKKRNSNAQALYLFGSRSAVAV